jgi:hypothetical protein
MEYNFDPKDHTDLQLVAPDAGEDFRKTRERERAKRRKEVAPPAKPENPESALTK